MYGVIETKTGFLFQIMTTTSRKSGILMFLLLSVAEPQQIQKCNSLDALLIVHMHIFYYCRRDHCLLVYCFRNIESNV